MSNTLHLVSIQATPQWIKCFRLSLKLYVLIQFSDRACNNHNEFLIWQNVYVSQNDSICYFKSWMRACMCLLPKLYKCTCLTIMLLHISGKTRQMIPHHDLYGPGQVAQSLDDFIAFHSTQTMYVSYCFYSLLCAFASP